MSFLPGARSLPGGESSFTGLEGSAYERLVEAEPDTPVSLQNDSPSRQAAPAGASMPRIRRRNRMITSCMECRRRKLKCDKLHPCTNCSKFSRDCVFLAPALDSASKVKLNEIKDKMGVLERGLEHSVASTKQSQAKSKKKSTSKDNRRASDQRSYFDLPGEISEEDSGDEDEEIPFGEENLEPTPMASADAVFDDEAGDEMLDLGVKMGRMRMTDRIGGYFRPKMAEELAYLIVRGQSGQTSSYGNRTPGPGMSPLGSPPPTDEPEHMTKQSPFLQPGPNYIAPGSNFLFGTTSDTATIVDFLPSQVASDRLIKEYYSRVHFIARTMHWPSFLAQYGSFWATISAGIEPPASLQALFFAVMFSAVVSMDESEVPILFSVTKSALTATFQTATEFALGRANLLRSTKFETLQALVIYLIPMCRNEMSRAHSVLVAAAIRNAQCSGLSKDPEATYGLSALDSHVRRMIWFQLCFLDIRTTESQGPRPIIRREDFDTNFPLNLNDEDLVVGNNKERSTWTDMTFSRLRFEITEMHRVIWTDRDRLEKKQITLTHVLGKIESFRKAMELKYHPIMDEKVPIQKAGKLVMDLLLRRMLIAILHRYHNTFWKNVPDRLRQIVITNGTQQMEDAVNLETDPMLRTWAWYAGTYQQWHTAFLLLIEVFAFPMRLEAERIWRIVDYVYETDSSLTREEKALALLTMMRDRTAAYRQLRKIRVPLAVLSHLSTGILSTAMGQETAPAAGSLADAVRKASLNSGVAPDAASRSKSPTVAAYPGLSTPAERTAAAATLGPVARAFADAPSPPAMSNTFADRDWTFDMPSTFFMPKDHTNKPVRSKLPGEQSVGSVSDAASPQGVALPQAASPSQPMNSNFWPSGFETGQNDGQQFTAQTVAQNTGMISPINSIPSPGVVGGNMGQKSNERPPGPTDTLMVDIDWNEWDKIFPPHINTGILNTPLPPTY